jgi:FkbM family methyltransferase
MKASIIIPAYRPIDLLKKCLDGIIQNTTLTDIEVIVVCNGSDRESADLVMNLGEPFKLVWYTEPLGFVRATNIGLKLAQSDNIVLLNTDAVILQHNEKNVWLDRLINPLQQKNVGITGLGLMYTEFGAYLPFYCTGLKKQLLTDVGYLDEDFSPGYAEDADYCYRARSMGYEVVQVDNPVPDKDDPTRTFTDFPIWHLGEQSFTDKQKRHEYTMRNLALLNKKYGNQLKDPVEALRWLEKKHGEIFKEVIIDNEYRLSREEIKNKNVLDIGANIGTFSLLSAFYGAKKVVSVEPASTTYNSLVENVKISGFNTIETLKNVVTNISGSTFNLNLQSDSGHNSLYSESENTESVIGITLTELLNKFDSDDIILKIDCEGAEYDILMNATTEELSRVKSIHIEIHGDLHPIYKGVELMKEKIKSFGFKKIRENQMLLFYWDMKGNLIDTKPLPTTLCYFEK